MKMQCGVCKKEFVREDAFFKHLKYGNKECRKLCKKK